MNHVERDERTIMTATVRALLASGRAITVNDGEEDTLKDSTDETAILEAMRTSDEDLLICSLPCADPYHGHPEAEPCGVRRHGAGWVRFIYGNSGWDVINDYTTNLEPIMGPINDLSESLS